MIELDHGWRPNYLCYNRIGNRIVDMKLHFVFSVIFLWCVFLCTSCDKQSVVEPAVEEDGSVVLTIKPQGFIHDSDIEYNHSGGGHFRFNK